VLKLVGELIAMVGWTLSPGVYATPLGTGQVAAASRAVIALIFTGSNEITITAAMLPAT